MRQIRVSKRHRPGAWRLDQQEPLPLDPRDPDIVRAKEAARRADARGRSAQGGSRRSRHTPG
jgi:hypothetical protein